MTARPRPPLDDDEDQAFRTAMTRTQLELRLSLALTELVLEMRRIRRILEGKGQRL